MKLFAASLTALTLFITAPVHAQSTSGSFQLSTDVAATCKIVSLSNLNIDNIDALDIAKDNQGVYASAPAQLVVNCTKGTPQVKVFASAGNNNTCGSGEYNKMKSADGHTLSYFLNFLGTTGGYHEWQCQDNSQSHWPVSPVLDFATTDTINVQYRAVLNGYEDLHNGSYSDTVTVDVVF